MKQLSVLNNALENMSSRLTVLTRTRSTICTALHQKPDDEYPDWLWSLLDRPASKEELMQEAEEHFRTGGLDGVLDNMDDARIKRLFKITAKERIKEGNMRRASGEIL